MINIEDTRNYMRRVMVDAAIVATSQIAFEGVPFDPSAYDYYIAEVIQPDNDNKAATTVDGAQFTMTYNVYSRPGATGTNKSYDVITDIASLWYDNVRFTPAVGVVGTVVSVSRRIATEFEGWRLSPIDITIRLEK